MKENHISQADLTNDSVFWDLQVEVAKKQMWRENELDGQDFISDRSVVDALVYATMRKPERFPSLASDEEMLPANFLSTNSEIYSFKNDAAERLLIPLIGHHKAVWFGVIDVRLWCSFIRSITVL